MSANFQLNHNDILRFSTAGKTLLVFPSSLNFEPCASMAVLISLSLFAHQVLSIKNCCYSVLMFTAPLVECVCVCGKGEIAAESSCRSQLLGSFELHPPFISHGIFLRSFNSVAHQMSQWCLCRKFDYVIHPLHAEFDVPWLFFILWVDASQVTQPCVYLMSINNVRHVFGNVDNWHSYLGWLEHAVAMERESSVVFCVACTSGWNYHFGINATHVGLLLNVTILGHVTLKGQTFMYQIMHSL